MTTSTILKKSRGFVIVGKQDLDELTRENRELQSAIKAILAGEFALRKGKTRTFREFLGSRSADAKNK